MNKNIALSVSAVTLFALSACGGPEKITEPIIPDNIDEEELAEALDTAQFTYDVVISSPETMQQAGVNLADGFCLANFIQEGWAADLVHNPREAVDDLPENQCSDYLNGTAQHLIELDLTGNLVRVL